MTVTRHRFTGPEEIFDLARGLAERFPQPRDVLAGIYELLLNAVEHGSLGMESGLKVVLLREGNFAKELSRRLSLPENRDKYVEVEWHEEAHFHRLEIRDQGPGFDWKRALAAPPPGSPHGRGLIIAAQCGFDALIFNERGNGVTCLVKKRAGA